jgi:hypothetical protein
MATSPDVETLERETAEARARLADTLDRLTSPETAQAVKQEFTDYVQHTKDNLLGTGRSKADGLKQRALANPVGLALIGAGIGWRLYKHPPITTLLIGTGIALLMKGDDGRRIDRSAYRDPYDRDQPRGYVPGGVAGYGYPVDEQAPGTSLADRATSAAGAVTAHARDLGAQAREAASGAGDQVSEAIDSARTSVTQAAESARTAVLGAADSARTTISEAATSARTGISDMAERTTSTVSHSADYARRRAGDLAQQAQTHPALLGVLGLAIGTAVAYSLRASDSGERRTSYGRSDFNRGTRGTRYRSGPGARRTQRATGDRASSGPGLGDAASRASEAAGDLASSAAETASGAASAAGRVLGAAGETVSSAAGSAYEAASSAYRGAADFAASATRRAPQAAGRVQHQLSELGERYPLLLGAVSLAVGAAVGGSLRLSESENRLMGPASDKLKRRAWEMADEQFEVAREAAEQFAGDLGGQFGTGKSENQRQDRSADFETVIGGGKPAASTSTGSTTGPGAGGRPPTPTL